MSTRRFVAAFLFVMALVLLGALPAHAQFQLRLEQAGFPSKTVTDNTPEDTDPAVGRISYIGAYGTFVTTINTGLSKPNIGNGVTQADMDLNSSEFSTSTGGTLQITLADTGFAFPNNNAGNQMTLKSSVGGTFVGLTGEAPAGTSVTFRAWANPTDASPLSVDPTVIPAGSVGVLPMGPFLTSPFSGNAAPVTFTKGAGPYSIFNQAIIFLPGSGQVEFDQFTRVQGQNCNGKLGNYVWNDLNHNGIQESGEPGIPGITVTLMKNGNPSATTTTDANGLYQFTGLCAASYTVEVPPQAGLTGYVASPTLKGGDFGTDSNPNPTTVSFVTDNNDDQTIDFGYYLPNPHLTLQKSPKGGTFNQGDPVSFSFVVGNDGGSPALNVKLTDQLPGNGGLVWMVGTFSQGGCTVANNLLSCNLGTIQPSGSVTVTVTSVGGTPLAACQAQPNPLATATADGGLSATDLGSLTCVPPQLRIVKTPDGGTFAVGAPVTFTIVVSNPAPAGASPASNVMLTDTLPNAGGLVWSTATTSQGTCAPLTSNNLSCTLGTIAAGASVTVTVNSTATTPASACQLQSNPSARATASGGLDVQDSGSMTCLPPGLNLVKSASVQITGPYQPVTYTYTVTNTGGTTLTNIVVTDDNGTPNFAGDDFIVGTISSLAPGASATLTATVIPVVSTVGVVNGNSVPAGAVIVVVPQANGDIKVTYLQSFGINDNTYGTGAIGWPSGHTFGNLTGSDKLEFRFFDKNGNMVLDIYQDYISATSLAPSGYASLCASGGDGSLVFGSLANIVSCTTSLADNLNNPLNLPNKAALIVNSPTSLVGGNVVIDPVKAPGGWNHINSYTVVVKASTFGSAGFGSVAVPDQHNSPNKLAGPNGMATTPTPSTVVNTARATANGGLTATATASVSIIPGSLGPASVSGFVYYDANNNGIKEPGEIGLGTTLTLTGTDSNGTPITRTTSSDGTTGAYSFTNLPPGDYKVTETQPASYLQGKNSVGTVNGVIDGVLVPVDKIDSIDLESGDAGINFNFGEIVASTPNLTLVKSANQQTIGPYQPVTYTYTVKNTGGTTVTNIVVTDDNGTPNFASDDITIGVIGSLAPGASATLTAQIIPVVSTVGVVNGNNVPAGAVIVVVPQGNGDIKVTYLQSFGINDNTYGTGAIGWPGNGHTFSHLTGSDKLEFRFFDKNGNVVLDIYQDYISATNLAPSGYASLCASGGDGSLVTGSLANIVSCTTSLADNLNNPANLPYKNALIVNSPTSLVGGNVVIDAAKAPGGWNHINSYTVVVKASTFGSAGFGSVAVPDQHNSPNKLGGPNGMATTATNSTVVNTATATANGGVSASGTASVAIVVPPAGGGGCSAVITTLKLDKKDFQVTIKNNGASDIFLSGFALTWPALNGKLVQLKLDGDEVYGSPDIAAPSANLTAADLVGDQNKRKIGHGSSDTLHILFEANVDKTPAHYADGLLTFGAGCTVSFP